MIKNASLWFFVASAGLLFFGLMLVGVAKKQAKQYTIDTVPPNTCQIYLFTTRDSVRYYEVQCRGTAKVTWKDTTARP